jgi:hypothetical protein
MLMMNITYSIILIKYLNYVRGKQNKKSQSAFVWIEYAHLTADSVSSKTIKWHEIKTPFSLLSIEYSDNQQRTINVTLREHRPIPSIQKIKF